MSRLEQRFTKLAQSGRRALVTFVTAGDPNLAATVPMMHGLVAGGADIIELGVPFSDPMADGPVIQRASERALAAGTSLKRVLEQMREFRQTDGDTPVVLMGYLNPFEAMGYNKFATQAAEAGVDGVLTVDLPPDEAGEFAAAMKASGLDCIFLVAPNSDDERIRSICDKAGGFIYYVSLKGVTGAAHLDVETVAERVRTIKTFTDLPVGVGFGIRDAESAARVAQVSDAVVVGTAIVQRVEDLCGRVEDIPGVLEQFAGELREAMDTATAQAS
ncbi:MAG: tryptophan synthase subunit alpha [Gammaproteobacteria bacterium]|nr:MAG: tryptophan synthase subunit alpha [Gammaproteobacteria bacterium]